MNIEHSQLPPNISGLWVSTRKLRGNDTLAKTRFAAAGLQFIPISAEHAAQVDSLELHHRDPFDRMLIAQSRCEPLHLLTRDAQLAIYSELVVLV